MNVKVISTISEELFTRQSAEYQNSVLPAGAKYDLMVVTTGTRRMWPLQNVGPLTDEYSLTSDWDNQWLTGGSESDVIAEAHLDAESIYAGIKRFADERESRLGRQREALAGLGVGRAPPEPTSLMTSLSDMVRLSASFASGDVK